MRDSGETGWLLDHPVLAGYTERNENFVLVSWLRERPHRLAQTCAFLQVCGFLQVRREKAADSLRSGSLRYPTLYFEDENEDDEYDKTGISRATPLTG
jgi:hypothetical protein